MPDPEPAPVVAAAVCAAGGLRLEPPVEGLTGVNVGGLTMVPAGVPGAYRILANLVSLGKNAAWRAGNQ